MKKCTKCGETKERTEFYVHRRLKNGGAIHSPSCKACKRKINAEHKRKTEGEYRTLEAIQDTQPKCECGCKLPHMRSKCYGCKPRAERKTDWELRIAQEMGKIAREAKQTAWTRRIASAKRLLKQRNPNPKKVGPPRCKKKTWEQAIATACRLLRKPGKTAWQKRIENAACMMNRKTRFKQQVS